MGRRQIVQTHRNPGNARIVDTLGELADRQLAGAGDVYGVPLQGDLKYANRF